MIKNYERYNTFYRNSTDGDGHLFAAYAAARRPAPAAAAAFSAPAISIHSLRRAWLANIPGCADVNGKSGFRRNRRLCRYIARLPARELAACRDRKHSIRLCSEFVVVNLGELPCHNAYGTHILYCSYTPNSGGINGMYTYVVQPGDTLLDIANRFGVSVEELAQDNDLADGVIYVGQPLRMMPTGQPVAPGGFPGPGFPGPGFPGPGFPGPGFPGPGFPGQRLERRVERLERQVERLQRESDRQQQEINQLERRVRRLEGR